MTSREAVSYSYAVFSFVVDDARGITVPIGVALWSPQRRWVKVRLVTESERLGGFDAQEHYPFVRLVRDKVQHWIETGQLPHREDHTPPFDDRWWRHVRELLIHRVRLSEPRPIDCRDPEGELEPLYESVVGPHRPSRERQARIDGEIRKCLNHLADRFKARQALPGYHDRPVPVLRAYHGRHGWVVIEGVNLAAREAELQSDALASKLQRLQAGMSERCEILVAYLASPEGLNGESVLVEWIRERTGARAFDLAKDRAEFHAAADESVTRADGQGMIE